MKRIAGGFVFAVAIGIMLAGVATAAKADDNFNFNMVTSAGAKTCLPNATGQVVVTPLGPAEMMSVNVQGLPPKTDFDFFVIQAPTAPFGLGWYQGDIETDATGAGHALFVGRFSIETFVVAPGQVTGTATPFTNAPFPDLPSNLGKEGPVHTYHLGLWFNSPTDAGNAGCPNTVTPFNGTHNAGIQVLNTSNFPAGAGPLSLINP